MIDVFIPVLRSAAHLVLGDPTTLAARTVVDDAK